MKALFGGILVAVGLLIAGASGLCSLAVLATVAGGGGAGLLEMLFLVGMIGGVPFAVGLGLFSWGRSLLRRAREEERD